MKQTRNPLNNSVLPEATEQCLPGEGAAPMLSHWTSAVGLPASPGTCRHPYSQAPRLVESEARGLGPSSLCF